MKTIVIWDCCGEESIRFFIVNGNYSYLDRLYINTYYDDEEGQKLLDELNNLVFNEDGSYKVEMLETFPSHEVTGGAAVIVAGFLP